MTSRRVCAALVVGVLPALLGCELLIGAEDRILADPAAGGTGQGGDGAHSTAGSGGTGGTTGGGGMAGQGGIGGQTGQGGGAGKRIFVTLQAWDGDLRSAGAGGSGLEGGDSLCQTAADAIPLGGTWKAWLSDNTVDALFHIADVGPWHLVGGGDVVFANRASIAGGALVPINRTASGDTAPFDNLVWTGTSADGTRTDHRCGEWTGSASATVGDHRVSGTDWTEAHSSASCFIGTYHLYCFEQ